MIQFNMLPDVKLEYVRSQRIKHTIMSASIIATGSAFLIFLLLFTAVHVVQKNSMARLTKDIKKYSTQLKNTPDLDNILTIQSQLGALPALHADKVAAGRTFKYIQQITPAAVTLNEATVDYVAHTISIGGQANTLDVVNALTDTLKLTTYKVEGEGGDTGKAFTGVVLSQFTRSNATATFTVTANYEPAIFDNTKVVGLTVPTTVSTPSVLRLPSTLFQKATTPTTTTTNGTGR